MSARLEGYLARLYVDAEVRRAFLADPRAAAARAGLAAGEITALEHIDRPGLELAARVFAQKRTVQNRCAPWRGLFWGRLLREWRC